MANIFEPFFGILLLNLIKHKSSAVKACFLQLKAMVKVTISNLATYADFRLSELLWVTVPSRCTTLSVWPKNEEPYSLVLTSDWFPPTEFMSGFVYSQRLKWVGTITASSVTVHPTGPLGQLTYDISRKNCETLFIWNVASMLLLLRFANSIIII